MTKQQNQQAQSLPSPTASEVPSNGTTPLPIVAEPMRSLVTAHNNGTMFNFWQKRNGDLWMHAYFGQTQRWADAAKLDIPSLPAVNNTALAAVVWPFDDYLVSLCPSYYYLGDDK